MSAGDVSYLPVKVVAPHVAEVSWSYTNWDGQVVIQRQRVRILRTEWFTALGPFMFAATEDKPPAWQVAVRVAHLYLEDGRVLVYKP